MTATNEREKFITELYSLYAETLDRHCRAYVAYAPEADGLIAECVQETFLSAFSEYETLKDHPCPRGWLLKTCHHRLLNALRKARRARKHEAFSLDQQAEEPEEQTLSSVERWLANEAAKEYEEEILSLLTGQEQAESILRRANPSEGLPKKPGNRRRRSSPPWRGSAKKTG